MGFARLSRPRYTVLVQRPNGLQGVKGLVNLPPMVDERYSSCDNPAHYIPSPCFYAKVLYFGVMAVCSWLVGVEGKTRTPGLLLQ